MLVPQKLLFEPTKDIPVPVLACKVALLFAITLVSKGSNLPTLSCKESFLVLLKENIVLQPLA